MSKVLVDEHILQDIANSIRSKTGSTNKYTPSQMSSMIDNLDIGTSNSKLDWSAIGYSEEPSIIEDGYEHAIQVKNNWNPTQKFTKDINLIFMPPIDTSSISVFSNMFEGCYRLMTIPQLNTSNGRYFSAMFANCSALENVPQIDLSKALNIAYLCVNCYSLKTIPKLDTSNINTFNAAFNNCYNMRSIPQMDASSCTNINAVIKNCNMLTDFGGFKNLGNAYSTAASANYSDYTLDINTCTLLTHESLMNVINGLYDIATKGCNTQSLVLGATNLAKLTEDEMAIAIEKGWNIS